MTDFARYRAESAFRQLEKKLKIGFDKVAHFDKFPVFGQ